MSLSSRTRNFPSTVAIVVVAEGCVVQPVVRTPLAAGTFVEVTSSVPIETYRPVEFSSAPTGCRTRTVAGRITKVVGDTVTLSPVNRISSADTRAACNGLKEATFVNQGDVMRMTTARLDPHRVVIATVLTATVVSATLAIALSDLK